MINQRHAEWWPADFQLTIARSAEHDWIAVVDEDYRDSSFANSLWQVVSDLRLRNAWSGH